MAGLTNITIEILVIDRFKALWLTINDPLWRIKINMLGLVASIVLTTLFFYRQQHDMCNFMAISGTMHIVAIVFSLLEHEARIKRKNGRS